MLSEYVIFQSIVLGNHSLPPNCRVLWNPTVEKVRIHRQIRTAADTVFILMALKYLMHTMIRVPARIGLASLWHKALDGYPEGSVDNGIFWYIE